jgi:hypothetical protein
MQISVSRLTDLTDGTPCKKDLALLMRDCQLIPSFTGGLAVLVLGDFCIAARVVRALTRWGTRFLPKSLESRFQQEMLKREKYMRRDKDLNLGLTHSVRAF